MTVTVEVMNQKTLNVLDALESVGLIHVKHPVPQDVPKTTEKASPYQWLRGCCENKPGASVEDFLARCREDKEYELAIEKRQEEERARARLAKEKVSS